LCNNELNQPQRAKAKEPLRIITMSMKLLKEQKKKLKLKEQVKRFRQAEEARRRRRAGRIDLSEWESGK